MNLFNQPIRSYEFNQEEILNNIIQLYVPGGRFEIDCTFSTGGFYRGSIPVPRLKFDVKPQAPGVIKAAAQKLPLQDATISSSMVDPPFFWGGHGGKMSKRFGAFKNYRTLEKVYQKIIIEQHRILKPGGILIFKCQDICNGRIQHFIHNSVLNYATGAGFMAKDLFLLLAKNRHFHPEAKQTHARKHHCYFWVFRKRQRRPRVFKNQQLP